MTHTRQPIASSPPDNGSASPNALSVSSGAPTKSRRRLPRGVELHGGHLRLVFTYGGRTIRRSTGLEPTPQNIRFVARWRAAILYEIAAGIFDLGKHFPSRGGRTLSRLPRSPSVAESVRLWLREVRLVLAPSTARHYEEAAQKVIEALGEVPIRELTRQRVVEWIASRAREVGPRRLRALLVPLRGAVRVALDAGVLERNILAGLRLPPHTEAMDPQPFTPEEVATILIAAPSAYWGALWLFGFSTGLRLSELIALRWSDIASDRLWVRRSRVGGVTRQTAKSAAGVRAVALLPPAKEALEVARQTLPPAEGDDEVWRDPESGRPFADAGDLRYWWRRTLERAGIPYRPAYHMRHTYASTLLSAGEDPTWVATQMGHRDWGLIRRVYARWIPSLRPEAGQQAAAKMAAAWTSNGERDGGS